ncbi:MAG: (Fe-S)-binding protein [Promethearchaeota archaeon]
MEDNNFIQVENNDFVEEFKKILLNSEDVKTLFTCYECGQCSASCPVGEVFPRKSHEMVRLSALGAKWQIINDNALRYCLTCRICQEYCPQGVDLIELIKLARSIFLTQEKSYEETHDGILTTITELQAKNQLGLKFPSEFIPERYNISKKGKVAYFYGCLPILNSVFDYLNVNSIEIAQNAIKVLNNVLEEPPVLMENIKCCGHDALWKGYFDTFKQLAEHNIKIIKNLGVETIITTCAECYRTLKIDYPKYIEGVDFQVLHISELIADKLNNGELHFSNSIHKKVTYHDPCRLGRHMKIYSPPREILTAMEQIGLQFNEMERNKEIAPCCGVSCFINCNDMSKLMQYDRLTEAEQVADYLITTCPKCQIHFKCLLHEKKETHKDQLNIIISDLTNLISEALEPQHNQKNDNSKGE